MRLVIGHDELVANWIAQRIGSPIHPPYTAMGWVNDHGDFIAGCACFAYVPGGNIELALAASRMFPRMIRTIASYCFNQCCASRVTVRTKRSNARFIEFMRRIGFVTEAICKAYFGDEDAVQMRMLRRECRWLN